MHLYMHTHTHLRTSYYCTHTCTHTHTNTYGCVHILEYIKMCLEVGFRAQDLGLDLILNVYGINIRHT